MKEMSFVEHLEELRSCLIKVLVILAVSFFACYALANPISEFLLRPLRLALSGGGAGEIIYLGILDKLLSQLQVAIWCGVIVSSPLWFYQIWSFISPGLYPHEVKVIRPFLLAGLFLFWLGVAFTHFYAFPLILQTLLQSGVDEVRAAISLKDYLLLISKILVLMGFLFQVPNILIILGFMGLVTKYSLRQSRRYIYVALAIFSALATPPDIVTMLALWFPLVALFEVGVLAVALIVHPFLERHHA